MLWMVLHHVGIGCYRYQASLISHQVAIICLPLYWRNPCKLPKNFRWIYASFLWKVFYNKGFLSTLLQSQLKQNTALLSTDRASMCPSVTGITSHISHIYKGINAMLIIRGPIKPCTLYILNQNHSNFLSNKTRPDKAIFPDLTNLTIDFDLELSKIEMLYPHCLLCLVVCFIFH